MEIALDLPDTLPVMTLPDMVFFPHAVLPLHIYEPRYKEMLNDVLANHRMFIVTNTDGQSPSWQNVATAGMIRSSKQNKDGTSDLILQGLTRVKMVEYLEDKPYRQARITPFHTPPLDHQQVAILRDVVWLKIRLYHLFYKERCSDILPVLEKISSPDTFLDLAAYSLCSNFLLKRRILETQRLRLRFELMFVWLKTELLKHDLYRSWDRLKPHVPNPKHPSLILIKNRPKFLE